MKTLMKTQIHKHIKNDGFHGEGNEMRKRGEGKEFCFYILKLEFALVRLSFSL